MIRKVIKEFVSVNIQKTLRMNFHYFPFRTACRLPIMVYKNVNISKLGGVIIINSTIRRGLLTIGRRDIGTLDHEHVRSIWEVSGEIVLDGKASFGSGSRISVANGAKLRIGKNFLMTGNSSIVCQKEITFGRDCLLSWEILIMDTDFHRIVNMQGEVINKPSPIRVGNHVWIGCRATLLKGAVVPDNVVIAAGSLIAKPLTDSLHIYGGNNKKLKADVNWKM